MRRHEMFLTKKRNDEACVAFATQLNSLVKLVTPPLTTGNLKCLIFIAGFDVNNNEARIHCL